MDHRFNRKLIKLFYRLKPLVARSLIQYARGIASFVFNYEGQTINNRSVFTNVCYKTNLEHCWNYSFWTAYAGDAELSQNLQLTF